MKTFISLIVSLLFSNFNFAQTKPHKFWRISIHRPDGKQIIFNARTDFKNGKQVLYFLNGSEAMSIPNVKKRDDSLFIKMPVFESEFRARIVSPDSLNGIWYKSSTGGSTVLPFTATTRNPERFPALYGDAKQNVSGKWAMDFKSETGKESPAIGTFTQEGNRVTGSVLTPGGDYRYLEGIISGDSLWFSGFDGIHALLFAAKVEGKELSGELYSGVAATEKFTGKASANPTLPNTYAVFLKPGETGHLNFKFKDTNGNAVSINDKRFKNKVVIIDIMGSWCPNCMDETAFLSDYYNKNKQRGVEVIALAYELSTDFSRSQKDLRKFQKRFDIKYPILITGVTATDKDLTEKTLLQFTNINMFPTTIILDKTGKVSKIDTGFQGPGTGKYYTEYKEEFYKLMNKLLEE